MAKKTAAIFLGILCLALLVFASKPVFATGQPNQSCQAVFPSGPLSPSGFNTAGFAHADEVYAGSGQNTQTPANSNAVSQYDVACFQVAQH